MAYPAINLENLETIGRIPSKVIDKLHNLCSSNNLRVEKNRYTKNYVVRFDRRWRLLHSGGSTWQLMSHEKYNSLHKR